MTNLFSALLRLTAATRACWKFFSTSTHITCNVMSGRKLSLRHSVKHYEAILFKSCFISDTLLIRLQKYQLSRKYANKYGFISLGPGMPEGQVRGMLSTKNKKDLVDLNIICVFATEMVISEMGVSEVKVQHNKGL